MSSSSGYKVFFIGSKGQLKGSHSTLTELSLITENMSQRVFSGYGHHIYSSDKYKTIYISGNNIHGECGVGVHQQYINKYHHLKYFQQHNIKINNICIGISGFCTFFISDSGELYGCGENGESQLGLKGHRIYNIQHIDSIDHVIHVESGLNFSIALSHVLTEQHKIMILEYWYKEKIIPYDIIDLIILFSPKSGNAYSTTSNPGSGQKLGSTGYGSPWQPILKLKGIEICQVKCGVFHSLFLEENGTVWSCGYDKKLCGCLGLDNINQHNQYVYGPQKIQYFICNNYKILDIACGQYHNLALDDNGNIFGWGLNKQKQCGHDNLDHINKPKLIEYFEKLKQIKIMKIKCGSYHSLVQLKDKRIFMFGSNVYQECIIQSMGGVYQKQRYIKPTQVDKVILETLNARRIVDIILGHYSTSIVVNFAPNTV